MSAPKPRVRQVQPRWTATYGERSHTYPASWDWECGCRAREHSRDGMPFDVAVQAAEQHSRTHTAERIAEQLARHALARRVDYFAVIDAAGRETDYTVYQQGVARGLEHAERLVRQHLVKETP